MSFTPPETLDVGALLEEMKETSLRIREFVSDLDWRIQVLENRFAIREVAERRD